MCECITEMDALLKEHNTRMGATIVFSKPSYVAVTLMTEAVTPKRGFRPKVVLPTYCPFCGRRYAPEKQPDAEGVVYRESPLAAQVNAPNVER